MRTWRNTFTVLTCALAIGAFAVVAQADVVSVPFTELSGISGGAIAGTAVYETDLSAVGLTSILSISIQDASFGLGGAAGQFSGFDLDAIKLSTTDCATAACAAGLAGLAVFNFPGGTIFAPGVQRVPTDPKLFGTGATGTTVDNTVATLGVFDGESTTAIPGAFGFLSMGDGGLLSFNLTAPVDPAGLHLYIGEVGDNGEVAAGSVVVRDTPVGVPEPSSTLFLLGFAAAGLGGFAWWRRRG